MSRIIWRRLQSTITRLFGIAAFATLSSCQGELPSAATPPTPKLVIADIVINDPVSGDIAYSHGDHWHGSIRLLRNEVRPHRFYFISRTQSSHDAPPADARITLQQHPDYAVRVTFEDATLARWSGGTFSGDFIGQYPGGTRVIFSVYFGATQVFASPPVAIVVRE